MNNLAKKLVLVMKDCRYVQKDKVHKQGYKYASSNAIMDKVNESLVTHGIATTCHVEVLHTSWEKLESGRVQHFFTVKTLITLHDTDSNDTMTISGIAEATNVAPDKASLAAQTIALKYTWMMTLNIATGNDPEADETPEEEYHIPAHIEQRYEPNESRSQGRHLQVVQSTTSEFVEKYNQAKNKNESYAVYLETNKLWGTFTKEERNLLTQAANKAKERIGVEVKNGKSY